MASISIGVISDEQKKAAQDILCDAYESGIAYWAKALKPATRIEATGDYLAIHICEKDASGEVAKSGTVRASDIVRAARTIIQNPAVTNQYVIAACVALLFRPDTIDYDAIVADALVQTALFGEIVYG
jgi:hypothetical protein